MMEDVTPRPNVEYIPPPLPPKIRQKNQTSGSTTFTQINSCDGAKINFIDNSIDEVDKHRNDTSTNATNTLSSMHSLVLSSSSPTATVFVAADRRPLERDTGIESADAVVKTPLQDKKNHVVTIRVNTESTNSKAPIISSVHLKSDSNFQTFSDIYKKNNSLVRLNVEEKCNSEEEIKTEKSAPYIYCSPYPLTANNMVMSSGQCSPSDTLDSGTCSDLDGTPPPLPKKKSLKTIGASQKKSVSVTLISSASSESNQSGDLDFEDNDSNISCDSLNSSELNGSVHSETIESNKNKNIDQTPPVAPAMPSFVNSNSNNDSSFLPQGLLQDIRDRSAKLNTIPTESEDKNSWHETNDSTLNVNIKNGNLTNESAQLTSFRLVSQVSKDNSSTKHEETVIQNGHASKTTIINESTYEERKKDKEKHEKQFYSGNFVFDTDKYYDFHLNEKDFVEEKCKSLSAVVSVKGDSADKEALEYFAGVKDFQSEEPTSTIRSSKGTIRGVKNRVRAGIATFLQIQSTTKSYKEKDAGKVVLYSTTMGIVRSTYQRCVLVKKILRNLLVKYEERDVFMSTEYQDEIRDRMRSDDILVPQLFIDGHHIGDADTVEKLNESGELRKMLKPYKSLDACNTCQVCGGFRLLPCRICNGSKKSLHRNHFTAEFVALKCMNCDEVGLVKCEACS